VAARKALIRPRLQVADGMLQILHLVETQLKHEAMMLSVGSSGLSALAGHVSPSLVERQFHGGACYCRRHPCVPTGHAMRRAACIILCT
jgi:hypothetical protein